MAGEMEPRWRPDAAQSEDEFEFEKLEFLPEEEEQHSGGIPAGEELTFEPLEIAGEPPVTVDPLDAPATPPDPIDEGGDPASGTPFELLGSSLIDRFSPDDSLDWAFDFDDDIDDWGD